MPLHSHEQTILDAGLRVFHSRGFTASSVQDITSAAGVPKGSFYSHFPSKDALGLAVLERYWESTAEAASILIDQSIAPLDRLERHFERLTFPEGCLVGNFSVELGLQEAFRPALLSKWRAWIAALTGCLIDGQRDGSVRNDLPADELARTVLALWQGAALIARAEGTAAPLAAALQTFRRLAC